MASNQRHNVALEIANQCCVASAKIAAVNAAETIGGLSLVRIVQCRNVDVGRDHADFVDVVIVQLDVPHPR